MITPYNDDSNNSSHEDNNSLADTSLIFGIILAGSAAIVINLFILLPLCIFKNAWNGHSSLFDDDDKSKLKYSNIAIISALSIGVSAYSIYINAYLGALTLIPLLALIVVYKVKGENDIFAEEKSFINFLYFLSTLAAGYGVYYTAIVLVNVYLAITIATAFSFFILTSTVGIKNFLEFFYFIYEALKWAYESLFIPAISGIKHAFLFAYNCDFKSIESVLTEMNELVGKAKESKQENVFISLFFTFGTIFSFIKIIYIIVSSLITNLKKGIAADGWNKYIGLIVTYSLLAYFEYSYVLPHGNTEISMLLLVITLVSQIYLYQKDINRENKFFFMIILSAITNGIVMYQLASLHILNLNFTLITAMPVFLLTTFYLVGFENLRNCLKEIWYGIKSVFDNNNQINNIPQKVGFHIGRVFKGIKFCIELIKDFAKSRIFGDKQYFKYWFYKTISYCWRSIKHEQDHKGKNGNKFALFGFVFAILLGVFCDIFLLTAKTIISFVNGYENDDQKTIKGWGIFMAIVLFSILSYFLIGKWAIFNQLMTSSKIAIVLGLGACILMAILPATISRDNKKNTAINLLMLLPKVALAVSLSYVFKLRTHFENFAYILFGSALLLLAHGFTEGFIGKSSYEYFSSFNFISPACKLISNAGAKILECIEPDSNISNNR